MEGGGNEPKEAGSTPVASTPSGVAEKAVAEPKESSSHDEGRGSGEDTSAAGKSRDDMQQWSPSAGSSGDVAAAKQDCDEKKEPPVSARRSPRLSHASASTARSYGSSSSRKTLPWSGGPHQLNPPPGVRTKETVPLRKGPKALKHVPSTGVIIRSGSTTDEVEESAAAKIQALSRGVAQRSQYHGLKQRNKAAVSIQSIIRGRKGRKRAQKKEEKRRQREKEANARKHVEAERDRLYDMLQEVEAEKQRLVEQVAGLEEVVATTREEKTRQKDDYEERIKALDDKRRTQEEDLIDAQEEVEKLEKANARLREEFGTLSKEANDNRERALRAEKALVEVKEQSEATAQAVQDASKRMVEISEKLEEAESQTAEKDKELQDALQQVNDLSNKLVVLDKSNQLLQKAAQEASEELQQLSNKEMKDAATSPRPDAENVLLEERDRAISSQAARIQVLTQAHGQVYGEVESLEAEIMRLQQRLVDKEKEAAEEKKQVARLERDLKVWKRKSQEVEGREFAMDQATKQNTELLKLLEEAEKEKEEADSERDEAIERMKEAEQKRRAAVMEAAEIEAVAKRAQIEVRTLREQLDVVKARADEQVEEMKKELDEVKKTSLLQVEQLQDEIRERRGRQYTLMAKLNDTEATTDSQEKKLLDAEMAVSTLQDRTLTLESQLMQANLWREKTTHDMREKINGLKSEIASLQKRLEQSEAEAATLKKHMKEMGGGVVRLAEKEREAHEKSELIYETVRAREGEISVLKEELARVSDEASRLQTEKDRLSELLEELQDEHSELKAQFSSLQQRTKGMGALAGTAAAFHVPSTNGPSTASFAASAQRPATMAGDGSTLQSLAASQLSIEGGGSVASTQVSQASQSKLPQAQLQTIIRSKVMLLQRLLSMATGNIGFMDAQNSGSAARSLVLHAVREGLYGTQNEDDKQVVGLIKLLLQEPHTTRRLKGQAARIGSTALGASLPPQVTLDLSNLGLGDEDIGILADALAATPMPFVSGLSAGGHSALSAAPLLALDLRGNAISDVGAILLSNLLSSPHTDAIGVDAAISSTGLRHAEEGHHVASRLAFIDLRGNKVSALGVRTLAEALRSHQKLAVEHVYVGGSGLIRALGRRMRDGQSSSLGIVCVIDARDNTGDTDTGDARSVAQMLRHRLRASRLGEAQASQPLPVARPDTAAQPQRQEATASIKDINSRLPPSEYAVGDSKTSADEHKEPERKRLSIRNPKDAIEAANQFLLKEAAAKGKGKVKGAGKGKPSAGSKKKAAPKKSQLQEQKAAERKKKLAQGGAAASKGKPEKRSSRVDYEADLLLAQEGLSSQQAAEAAAAAAMWHSSSTDHTMQMELPRVSSSSSSRAKSASGRRKSGKKERKDKKDKTGGRAKPARKGSASNGGLQQDSESSVFPPLSPPSR